MAPSTAAAASVSDKAAVAVTWAGRRKGAGEGTTTRHSLGGGGAAHRARVRAWGIQQSIGQQGSAERSTHRQGVEEQRRLLPY